MKNSQTTNIWGAQPFWIRHKISLIHLEDSNAIGTIVSSVMSSKETFLNDL